MNKVDGKQRRQCARAIECVTQKISFIWILVLQNSIKK